MSNPIVPVLSLIKKGKIENTGCPNKFEKTAKKGSFGEKIQSLEIKQKKIQSLKKKQKRIFWRENSKIGKTAKEEFSARKFKVNKNRKEILA